jgi:cell division protein FtsL
LREKIMARYINGNTVRKEYRQEDDRRFVEIKGNKHRHLNRMSKGNLLFMVAAIVAMCAILVTYISIQSSVTQSVKNIAELESTLNTMKQDNDEAYNKAISSVDLEEVKRIAIEEYGMTYANDGQIITYSNEGGNDYVRQVAPVPESGE